MRLESYSHDDEAAALQRASDRSLRWVLVWTYIPSFVVLLVYGVASKDALPALGIIPLTFSTTVAIVHISTRPRKELEALAVFIDLVSALGLFGVLVASWIDMQRNYWIDKETAMAASYGMAGMLVNFVIHLWFVLRRLIMPVLSYAWSMCGWFETAKCANCQAALSHGSYPGQSSAYRPMRSRRDDDEESHDSKESFRDTPTARNVLDMEDTSNEPRPSSSKAPRPSTDDETARLV